jgi:putative transposase
VNAYELIQAERACASTRALCRTLGVSRSAFHRWSAQRGGPRRAENARLTVHIRALHLRSRGTYGSPRIRRDLAAEGLAVGRKRVARLMRAAGLSGTPKRRFRGTTTDSGHPLPVANNLLQRDFTANKPNQAWVGDITYLPTTEGWTYLAVILDLFSRKVVGWALESHMETSLCTSALRQAIATRAPKPGLVHHTDRGSQYASVAYGEVLKKNGLIASMSRKGNCWDNAVAESFFGTLEQELFGPMERKPADLEHMRKILGDYIHHFYNTRRRHSKLDYQSPVDFENRKRLAAAAA